MDMITLEATQLITGMCFSTTGATTRAFKNFLSAWKFNLQSSTGLGKLFEISISIMLLLKKKPVSDHPLSFTYGTHFTHVSYYQTWIFYFDPEIPSACLAEAVVQ